ncbi:hypothetical protein TNCV_2082501 [Trichonephila clavipes]|nr:hypothetical protein TNCV_2082501 [Trichonephila clavipes]
MTKNALPSNHLGAPHGVSDPGWNKLHCVDGSKNRLWFGHYPRISSPLAHSEGIPRGDFRKMKSLIKLPQATSTYPDSCTGRKAAFGRKISTFLQETI